MSSPRASKALGWMITIVLCAGWFVALRPQALGGPLEFVGVSGHSMLPTMHTGDLTIAMRQSHYAVGDVVAYEIPKGSPGAGLKIIHRIVGGDGETGFVTQGDNNSYTDAWRPTNDMIVGSVGIRLPGVAGFLARLRTPGTLAIVVFATTFVIVLLPDRRRKDEPQAVTA